MIVSILSDAVANPAVTLSVLAAFAAILILRFAVRRWIKKRSSTHP